MDAVKSAFIVRPFGTRNGINFDDVDKLLVQAALKDAGLRGGTTGQIVEAGDIREDMFHLLLVADLVVADVSLHNANVFYELGVRHSLQPQNTVLVRARRQKPRTELGPDDEVPFDIKGLRYLEYDPTDPAAAVKDLSAAIVDTLRSTRQDSPVFRLLPDLQAQDRRRFLPVPVAFREDVELAAKRKRLGLLGLLGLEARDFPWASEGLRLVGRAQFALKAWRGAKVTLESLLAFNPLDIEALLLLGTIYQRLDDLDASDQVVARVLANRSLTSLERAEANSLLGRNLKDRWRNSWKNQPGEQARRQALRSPYLLQACEKYWLAFKDNLNHFYPGLNALALLTITVELAKRVDDVWKIMHRTADESRQRLQTLEEEGQLLAGAVWNSLEAARAEALRIEKPDRWLEISSADYEFLTRDEPERVGFLYESALTGAEAFHFDAARNQIDLFGLLGIFESRVQSAIAGFPPKSVQADSPSRVVLFTGHMIDAPGRTPPRFPAASEPAARVAIREKLQQELDRTRDSGVIAIASGANGGDILFHEVCDELQVSARLMLPVSPDRFRTESVSPAGAAWERRFDRLMGRFQSPPYLAQNDDDLPLWLQRRGGYNTWQRANMWLLQEALALAPKHLTLLALWDGTEGDGPGGTEHMIRLAKQCNAATIEIRTQTLAVASST